MQTDEAPTILDFEDFRLGQKFSGGGRLVSEDDVAAFAALSGDRHPLHTDAAYATEQGFRQAIVHGPFGLASFFGWFFELNVARRAIVAMLDTNWRYLAPIHVGDRLSCEMTITKCQRLSSRDRGVVGRHVRVLNQHGVVVQEGTTSLLVRARSTAQCPAQELLTRGWATGLADRLNADERFRSATATWDGAIALAGDREEAQFRIYRGKVIEAGVRAPNGPTFTLVASDLTWSELISGPRNDFMQRAMQGAFSVRGAAYEYLRLTRALDIVVDVARTHFQEGTGRDPR
jgi:acyl dehydratase